MANNTIYDCGQAAIAGHMGGAFSLIENNHIYRAGARREFFGWERLDAVDEIKREFGL